MGPLHSVSEHEFLIRSGLLRRTLAVVTWSAQACKVGEYGMLLAVLLAALLAVLVAYRCVTTGEVMQHSSAVQGSPSQVMSLGPV